jgi:hypothetical protein
VRWCRYRAHLLEVNCHPSFGIDSVYPVEGPHCVSEPGASVLAIGPSRLRFTYVTPGLITKLRMETPRTQVLPEMPSPGCSWRCDVPSMAAHVHVSIPYGRGGK